MVRGEIELGPCLFSLALLNRMETHKTLGFWGLSVRVLYYHPSRWSLWIVSLLILFCVKKFHWDAIHPTFVLHFTKCIATYRSVPTSSGLWNSPITTHSGGPFEWLESFIFFFCILMTFEVYPFKDETGMTALFIFQYSSSLYSKGSRYFTMSY